MNATTKTTIDWNKAAHVMGIILLVVAKGAWWAIKHFGILLFLVVTALFSGLKTLISAWASMPETGNDEQIKIRGCDENGLDINTGLPHKNVL